MIAFVQCDLVAARPATWYNTAMLIDDVFITVKAGNGGKGAATFRRNAQTARGGPDGGNGGNGGSIYAQGINDITALSQFQYKKNITGENGVNGAKQNLYGRNGEDNLIYVPLGTIIVNTQTDESIEIDSVDQKILLAKGGKGGRGNNEFKTATNQAPKYAELGEEGEFKKIHLILRLIADVGFIGLPNAGKSSLLRVLTNAKPKIGDYPFTTLEPNLGVLDGIILTDIPGLIQGASHGKGLGIKFLKHVEKTHILFHCIEVTQPDLLQTYALVRHELESYSDILVKKKEVILLTKTDLVSPGEVQNKIAQLKSLHKEILSVSLYSDAEREKLKQFILQFKTK